MLKKTEFTPFVPASTILPEITTRGVLLGIILAILLVASSTFMGLKIARTISGSIPAALISMVLLGRFKRSNILENNMVQTIASAGEVVAAGMIFTVPALVIMGYWPEFHYFQTVLITLIGGLLGVMFSIPLRRTLVVEERLPYPEGLAIAEVLKAGEEGKEATHTLIVGAVFAALISFLQTVLKVAGETLQYWTRAGSTAFGISFTLSPILMAAGYIVGLRALIAFIAGGVLTWGIAIPIFAAVNGVPEGNDLGAGLAAIQKNYMRFVGVGVFAIGGLWSVVSVGRRIGRAIKTSFAAMKAHRSEFAHKLRTDRDFPFRFVFLGVLVLAVLLFCLFLSLVKDFNLNLAETHVWFLILFTTLFTLAVVFIAATVAAYLVGIVGTTSLPGSGIALAAIIAFSSLLLLFFSGTLDFSLNQAQALKVAGFVMIFAAVVCVAAMVSGDNMQDLKAGFEVGSTPWKLQGMLAIGALVSAIVAPFILETTFQAYGIGDIFPRPGMDPGQALPAPQAMLMATVAKGFFIGKLPWNMIYYGAVLAVVAIGLDEYLKRTSTHFRFPPLLFALGIYLPLGYITAFFVGGLINHLVSKKLKIDSSRLAQETNTGILCASGIIAGEAILGAIFTIFFAYYKTTDKYALSIPWLKPYEMYLGAILFFALGFYLYKQAIRKRILT